LGGPVAGGRTYLVGENGPEMFTAPSNGIITPSGRVSGVGQGGMIFQLQGEFIQRGGDLVAAIAQTTRYQGRNS
jgi:phage-related minor tail protein